MVERTSIPKIKVKKGQDVEACKQYHEAEQTEEQTFLALTSEERLQPQIYSSLSKLSRVTASVDRFLENRRLPAAQLQFAILLILSNQGSGGCSAERYVVN